jgi:hypothetical protein
MSYDCNLTKKGKKYYRAVLDARTPAPEGEAILCRLCSMGWKMCDCISEPLYASPVVPVGVSREEIARIVARDLARQDLIDDWQPDAGWDLTWGYVDQQPVHFGEIADAILAAIHPTDTGRE